VTGWIFLEGKADGTGIISNVNIYNNVLTSSSASSFASNGYIALGIKSGNIYNNTIAAAGKGSAVGIGQNAIDIDIKNNVFYKVSTGISVFNGTIRSCDRNAYYGLSGNQMYYQAKFYTLAKWQSVLGFDRNGIITDPLLSSTHHPASNSPARGKGENLGGIFVKDKRGVTRPAGGWTIGAYQ
jgi:hypothetical protein